MLRALKESMKEWLMEHERLYWYIVVALAVFAFGIITMLGVAKLEKANAAEEITFVVPWYGTEVEISNEGYPYYFISYEGEHTKVFFSEVPLFGEVINDKMWVNSKGESIIVYGASNYSSIPDMLEQRSIRNVGFPIPLEPTYHSNYDLFYKYTEQVMLPANPCILPTEYSADAPYVKFDYLKDSAPLRDKVLNGWQYTTESINVKDNPNASSYWIYHGHVADLVNASDLENMMIEVSYEVELPSYSWLCQTLEEEGLLCSEITADAYDGRIRNAVSDYDKDKSVPRVTYRFVHVPPLGINGSVNNYILEDGTFSYLLTYEDILNYLFYFNEDLREMYRGDSNVGLRNYLMAFAHIESTTSLVFVENETEKVYGRAVINYYSRGSKNAVSAEVMADVFNATSEELEKAISDALAKGYDDALGESQGDINDLENRIDELESQLNGMTAVDTAFGDLQGADLWIGFVSLVEGLASLAPAISALSVLTGAVFGFMPGTITAIISFTLFAICIIAIVKAIRR